MVLAANFPDGSGYVLAAYLIFAILLLVYLGITAYRLLGLERRLSDVSEQLAAAEARAATGEADADAERDPEAVR